MISFIIPVVVVVVIRPPSLPSLPALQPLQLSLVPLVAPLSSQPSWQPIPPSVPHSCWLFAPKEGVNFVRTHQSQEARKREREREREMIWKQLRRKKERKEKKKFSPLFQLLRAGSVCLSAWETQEAAEHTGVKQSIPKKDSRTQKEEKRRGEETTRRFHFSSSQNASSQMVLTFLPERT